MTLSFLYFGVTVSGTGSGTHDSPFRARPDPSFIFVFS